ncbi:hypothetical protein FRC07_003009 [Ceratobasidium sp. 392]|nr:hypothetical protein FRC07_003009 [Ceratobasidium sp. 392]
MYRRCLGPILTLPLRGRGNISVRVVSSSTRQLDSENNTPWFMRDESHADDATQPPLNEVPRIGNQTLPADLPEHLATLHRHLSQSPLLAPFTLRICKPSSIRSRTTTDDLTLPYSRIKGRRRRGVHDAGESVGEPDDMWSWYVIAEVKEGTEGRGAIETVIRNAQRETIHTGKGQATVTYMLQGSSQHEDSTGNLGTLNAGDAQWMVAGRGVKHAEMPVYQEGLDIPIGLQLWVNLPIKYKMTAPTYKDIRAESIPLVSPKHDSNINIRILSGTSCGTHVPVPDIGGCWYLHIRFSKEQSSFKQELPPKTTTFIYIIKGSLRVAGSETFSQHAALVLSCNPEEEYVDLCSRSDETEIILVYSVLVSVTYPDIARAQVAAEPLNQPVARFGPFVMNTKDELKKALLDCT